MLASVPDAPNTLRLHTTEPMRSEVDLHYMQRVNEDLFGLQSVFFVCNVTFWRKEDLQTCLLHVCCIIARRHYFAPAKT